MVARTSPKQLPYTSHTSHLNYFSLLNFFVEARHRHDTDNRLRANMLEQKNLTEAATQAELEHKAKQLQDKVRVSW